MKFGLTDTVDRMLSQSFKYKIKYSKQAENVDRVSHWEQIKRPHRFENLVYLKGTSEPFTDNYGRIIYVIICVSCRVSFLITSSCWHFLYLSYFSSENECLCMFHVCVSVLSWLWAGALFVMNWINSDNNNRRILICSEWKQALHNDSMLNRIMHDELTLCYMYLYRLTFMLNSARFQFIISFSREVTIFTITWAETFTHTLKWQVTTNMRTLRPSSSNASMKFYGFTAIIRFISSDKWLVL